MSQKLLLVDISHSIFRAWYSVPKTMKAPDGTYTGAVHGTFQILLKTIETFEPDLVGICWDKGKPQHRKDSLPEYKSGRVEVEDHLKKQFPIVKNLLESLNVPQLELPGYEADDLIGTISAQAYDKDIFTYILSGDKDMLQLVNEKVNLISPKKMGEVLVYDEKEVINYCGVKPSQYLDLIGLKGDASDCIPGVKGIGIKTASKLINEYGTLENVIRAAQNDEISGKPGALIAEQHESALMSKSVAAIHRDLDIDMDWNTVWGSFNFNSVKELYQYYGLNTITNRLRKHEGFHTNNKRNEPDTYLDLIGDLSDEKKEKEKEKETVKQDTLF